jgi:hypothetical protein
MRYGKMCDLVAVTESKAPFPTTTDEGVDKEGGEMVESIPAPEVMCELAPGGFSVMVLKECARKSWCKDLP